MTSFKRKQNHSWPPPSLDGKCIIIWHLIYKQLVYWLTNTVSCSVLILQIGTAAGLLVDVPWSCRLVLGGYCGAAVWPNSHARLLPLCNIISDKSKITQPLHHSPSLLQLLVLPASSRHPVSSILQLFTNVTDLAHQHHPRRCPLRKSSKNAVFFA